MFKKLSAEDKNKITNYIVKYNEVNEKNINLENVLGEWAYGKSMLLGDLFGDNLILSKQISIEKSIEVLEQEMYENEIIRNALDDIGELLEKNRNNNAFGALDDKQWEGYWGCIHTLNTVALAQNVICEDFEYTLPNTNITIKGQFGMKPMKVINKLCEALGYDKFEELRLAHSQVLNKKTFTGELCLSIHPLDYMTMSDNDSGWHTCMTWPTDGCHRAGTIEMMNSSNVVVAYLKSSKDMVLPDGTPWNNKKWRTLVIVEPDFGITTIKDYPYQEENLDRMVVEWVKELLIATGNNDDFIDAPIVRYNYEEINISFHTEAMYNDFGAINTHCGCFVNAFIREGKTVKKTIDICYSGPLTCIVCGEQFSGSDSSKLICYDCRENRVCSHCYRYHTSEELVIGEDGRRYCLKCHKKLLKNNSIITNEPTLATVMNRVWLLDTEVSDNPYDSELYVHARQSEINDEDKWMELFGCKVHYKNAHYWIDLREVSSNFDRIVANISKNIYGKGHYTTFEDVLEYSTIHRIRRENNNSDWIRISADTLAEFKRVLSESPGSWGYMPTMASLDEDPNFITIDI